MTRQRTSSRRRQGDSPSSGPTWDERLINRLTPWRREIAGLLLLLLAILTLLGLLNISNSGPLVPWTNLLRQFAGWGVYPLFITVAAVGAYITLQRLDLPIAVRASQLIGVEIIILVALALSHLIFGDGLTGALNGRGGGLVGWALSDPLLDFLGAPLTAIVTLIFLSLGTALAAGIGWGDVVRWLNQTSIRLQLWSAELDAEVADRQAQIDAKNRESNRRANEQPADEEGRTQRSGRIRGIASPAAIRRDVALPPLNLLDSGSVPALSSEDIELKQRIIEQTLQDFGLPAAVTEIRRGPTVTQFGVSPGYIERSGPDGELKQFKVRVGQIASLHKDLALALEVPRVRIEAPVPGRGIVGVEVPNSDSTVVRLREVIESDAFKKIQSHLAVGLGRDVSGTAVATDLGSLPHLLIAGTTGSGKSVCLNALITCLVFNNSPEQLKLVMIDPKKVEFIRFNGLPHLLGSVEVEGERIIGVLRWLTVEMDRRYQVFEESGVRNLKEYQAKIAAGGRSVETDKQMPYIGVFIDELADLITSYPGDVEKTLCRLAQMARATGIHLVVATQRPSTDVITGLIKANFPARASFAVASNTDSRVILDGTGAEQLLGRGDMLFLSPDASVPIRLQGCFVSDQEMERIVAYWQQNYEAPPHELPLEEESEEAPWDPMIVRTNFISERDELLEEVIELAKKREMISTSYIQRRLRIGYPRAARLMEALYEMGLVDDPKEGGKKRRTLVSEEDSPLDDLLSGDT